MLRIANDVLERGRYTGLKRVLAPYLHPNGIKQMATSRGLRIAYAVVHLLGSLERGKGTIGLEVLDALPEFDALIVPVGGGGLISGCATAAKALKPDLKVYGVEASNYPAMRQRLHNQPVAAGGETPAEGIAVNNVGERTYSIVEQLVEDVLTVEEASIEQAIASLFELRKIVAEGAGAVGVAALLEHGPLFAGKTVATLITGGNIDARLFAALLQRDLARNGHLVHLRVVSPGKGDIHPRLAALLAENDASVVSLQFDQVFHAASAKSPAYDLVLETRTCATPNK